MLQPRRPTRLASVLLLQVVWVQQRRCYRLTYRLGAECVRGTQGEVYPCYLGAGRETGSGILSACRWHWPQWRWCHH